MPPPPSRCSVLTTLLTLLIASTNITSAALSSSSRHIRRFSNNQGTVATQNEIIYSPFFPTCANDATVADVFGPTPTVIVRPDCDLAIEQVCRAVQRETSATRQVYMQNVTATFDTCQVAIQFPLLALRAAVTYEECVAQCQAITVDCMLVGVGKWAKEGAQAGLTNMRYQAAGRSSRIKSSGLAVSTKYLLRPGYMIGPPNYFTGVQSPGEDPTRVAGLAVGVASASASVAGGASDSGPTSVVASPAENVNGT